MTTATSQPLGPTFDNGHFSQVDPPQPSAPIRNIALFYHSLDLNVIANKSGTKTPCHIWKGGKYKSGRRAGECGPNWTTQQQTIEDVIGFPWHNAGALGLVNGPGGLRTFDFDKCPTIAPVKAALAAMDLPADYQWQGRSGSHNGYGLAVICDELPAGLFDQTGILIGPPRQVGDFHQLELRAYGCQTVVAPSLHKSGNRYEWLYGQPSAPPARVSVDQLMAGFLAIAELPTKPAPAEHRTIKPTAPIVTDGKTQKDIRDAVNRSTTPRAYLESRGSTSRKDGNGSCPCGAAHSGDGQITYGDRVATCHSTRGDCLLSASGPNGRNSHSTWDLIVTIEYAGDWRAAYIAHGFIFPEPRTSAQPRPRQEAPHYTAEQAAAYNATRNDQRHTENRQALDRTADAIGALDLSERAMALGFYLIGQAHDIGHLQVRPTNEEIGAALGYGERTIQYAFRDLEAARLGKRQGGRGGLDRPNERAVWTFYRNVPAIPRVQNEEIAAPRPNEECTLGIYKRDLNTESVLACEPPASQPGASYDPFADYAPEADQPEHGADELLGLNLPEEQVIDAQPVELNTAIDGILDAQPVEPEAPKIVNLTISPDATGQPGASYDPARDLTDQQQPLPGAAHEVPAWQRIVMWPMQRIEQVPDAEQPATALLLLGMPEPEPLVLAPPADDSPQYRDFVWRWKAAKQADRSDAQRKKFRSDADRLLEAVPPAEAAQRWAMLDTGRRGKRTAPSSAPLTSLPAARRALAPAEQAGLWGAL